MLLNGKDLYEFAGFTIDLAERTLWRSGEMIPLAPKIAETLCLLVENHGRLLPKEELMERLWSDTFVEERNLTQNIFTLRKVLGEKESGTKFIETLPRRGYRFVAEVRPVSCIDEGTIRVSHQKQTRISAEGFVSTRQLTEAVKELTSASVHETTVEDLASAPTAGSQTKGYFRNARVAGFGILVALASSVALWGWQNYVASRPPDGEHRSDRVLLEFERLTDSGKAYFPTVSPDRQSFAFISVEHGKYAIQLQNIATRSKTVVVPPSEKEIGRAKFSPDGNYLFYRQDEKTGGPGIIYQIPIFGGTPRVIVNRTTSEVSISPDGHWLAFIRLTPERHSQELVICRSADGSDEKVVSTRSGNESFILWGFSPSWSPDGTKVFVGLVTEATPDASSAGHEGFGLMSVADGSFERISTPKWNNFIQAEWQPDGKSIWFLAREKATDPYQIWKVSYPDGKERRVTNDSHDYRYFSIAGDGEFILATHERTFYNLWLIPVTGSGDGKQLTFSSELRHGDRGVSWTPDGKELVYTLVENNEGTNLWKLNVATLENRQLTFDRHRINWYPRVTPDGASVIFSSNRDGGTHVWQMRTDGSDLRPITAGPGESFSNITGDGKWLIYASPAWNPEALWKRSLANDTEPVKLLTGAGGSNSISPDSKHLIVSYKTAGENGKL